MNRKPKRRGAGRRGPLDRRTIAKKALAQIDAKGLDALSMRRLGAALGVEAMSLYHHFRNKAELLDGVLELLMEEVEPPPDSDMPPLRRIRRYFENMRRLAISHSRAFLLLPTRRFRTRSVLEFYERLLQVFRDAGFNAAQSARYFRVLAGFVTGAGLAEIGSRALQPDATPVILEEFSDPEHLPRVTEVVPHLRVAKLGLIFSFGLDLIFEAMEKELRRRSAGGGSAES